MAESADIKTDAFRDLYAEFGEDIVARCVDYHMRHAGISRVRKIELFHKEYLGLDLAPKALDEWVRRYSEIVENKVVTAPAVAGATEFLEGARGKLKLYVISGTPEDELQRIVAARGWAHYFEEVHGSPRLKPQIIDDIVERSGLDKNRVLFVGDAMTDYDAADETGLAFLGRVAPHHENCFPQGTKLVDDLMNLQAFVNG